MPVLFSYDLADAPTNDHSRLVSAFKRLGWEHLGGSAFRYPPLGQRQREEDWFNQVLPALMLFRSYALKAGKTVKKFSLDVQSSTGYREEKHHETKPVSGADLSLKPAYPSAFGETNLRKWLDGSEWPYD